MHLAARQGHRVVCDSLIEAGADINASDEVACLVSEITGKVPSVFIQPFLSP